MKGGLFANESTVYQQLKGEKQLDYKKQTNRNEIIKIQEV